MLAISDLKIDSLPLAFGIIMAIIGLVFYTQGLPGKFWRRFYAVWHRLADLWFYRHLSVASKLTPDDAVNGCVQDIGLGLEGDCHVFCCKLSYYC